MIYIYCKTLDTHNRIGDLLCMANSVQIKDENDSWVLNKSEDDCWIIETNCNQSPAAIIYRIRNDVVCIEVDSDCAPKIIEPLMKEYGFNNVKWLLTK